MTINYSDRIAFRFCQLPVAVRVDVAGDITAEVGVGKVSSIYCYWVSLRLCGNGGERKGEEGERFEITVFHNGQVFIRG